MSSSWIPSWFGPASSESIEPDATNNPAFSAVATDFTDSPAPAATNQIESSSSSSSSMTVEEAAEQKTLAVVAAPTEKTAEVSAREDKTAQNDADDNNNIEVVEVDGAAANIVFKKEIANTTEALRAAAVRNSAPAFLARNRSATRAAVERRSVISAYMADAMADGGTVGWNMRSNPVDVRKLQNQLDKADRTNHPLMEASERAGRVVAPETSEEREARREAVKEAAKEAAKNHDDDTIRHFGVSGVVTPNEMADKDDADSNEEASAEKEKQE